MRELASTLFEMMRLPDTLKDEAGAVRTQEGCIEYR
jgi:hypothetical protein